MRVDHGEAVAEPGHIGEERVGIRKVVEKPECENRVESAGRLPGDLHSVAQDERRSFNSEDRTHELALPDVEELAVDAEDLRTLERALDREVPLEAADVHDAVAAEVASEVLAHDAHDLAVRGVVVVTRRGVHPVRQGDIVIPR